MFLLSSKNKVEGTGFNSCNNTNTRTVSTLASNGNTTTGLNSCQQRQYYNRSQLLPAMAILQPVSTLASNGNTTTGLNSCKQWQYYNRSQLLQAMAILQPVSTLASNGNTTTGLNSCKQWQYYSKIANKKTLLTIPGNKSHCRKE